MPTTKINGLDFYYEIHGEGEPVILINGVFNSTISWKYQTDFLKNDYQVIVYDCRDQGQTEQSKGEYDFKQHLLDLNQLMETLRIKRAHIVGVSYGATIALQFAYIFPNRVDRLGLISGLDSLDPKTEAIFNFINDYFEKNSLSDFFRLVLLLGVSSDFYNQIAPMIPQLAENFAQRASGSKQLASNLIESAKRGQMPDIEKVKTIVEQTLIVYGELDNYVNPDCSIRMHKNIKNSRLVKIKDCGHSVMIEKPNELNSVLIDFLRG